MKIQNKSDNRIENQSKKIIYAFLLLSAFTFMILSLSSNVFAEAQDYAVNIKLYNVNPMNFSLQSIIVKPQWNDYLVKGTPDDGSTVTINLMSDGKTISSRDIVVDFNQYTESKDNTQRVGLELDMSINMPYNSSADTIQIKTKGMDKRFLLHNYICKKDNICNNGENYVTCPEDCPVTSDGICNPRIDGVCDPDCGNTDLDCLKQQAENSTNVNPVITQNNTNIIPPVQFEKNTTAVKPTPQSQYNMKYVFFGVGLAFLIIIIVIIIIMRVKPIQVTGRE